jgi:acyl carrier protein
MPDLQTLETDIKMLIIESLDLEDITPDDIDSNTPLFIEGLGLDSIDALEIGVALQKTYKLKIGAKPEEMKAHFYSVHTIAKLIKQHVEQQ